MSEMTQASAPLQQVRITGRTRLFAILGHPVSSVRSPEFFNQVFADQHRDAVFIALDVRPENLKSAWQGLRALDNLDGVVVTMPHKNAVVPLLERTTERAARLGAVNTIRREADGGWCGDMCDGEGFAQALEQQGALLTGASALLVGAGGAGAAIAFALAERGLKTLHLQDHDAERIAALERSLKRYCAALVVKQANGPIQGLDFAINATPLGMHADDALPFDPRILGVQCHVCDVIGNPSETALLKAAQELGLVCHRGDAMHSAQARIAMRFLGLAD